jgi:hypothetical protein
MKISRDGLERFQGTFEDQWYNRDDEYWEDVKVKEVRFPRHRQYQSGECITYHISELKSK